MVRTPGVGTAFFLWRVNRLVASHAALDLLRTGLRLELFQDLREPRAPAELAARRGLDPELLFSWLRACHAQGIVSERRGHYRIRRFTRRLLDDPEAEALRARLDLAAGTVADRLDRLPELLAGAPRPAFGSREEHREAAASAGLLHERALAALLRVPGAAEARRILDLGCGDGRWLATWLTRFRDSTGVGVERDPALAERARARLREADVWRRGEVRVSDLASDPLPTGVFDLVLIAHTLHYLPARGHQPLFERIRPHLSAGGLLAIVTPLVSVNRLSRLLGLASGTAVLDLFLRSHRNLHGLPEPERVMAALRRAGYAEVGRRRVTPGGTALLLYARAPAEGAPSLSPGPLSSTTFPSGSRT